MENKYFFDIYYKRDPFSKCFKLWHVLAHMKNLALNPGAIVPGQRIKTGGIQNEDRRQKTHYLTLKGQYT